MPVDPGGLTEAMAMISKSYGASTMRFGSEFPPVPRISTGSVQLDWATFGGIPIGRFSRLYGDWSSGKTLSAFNVIRNAQAMGLTCAYYNAENQYDETHVKRLGVDTDKLVVVDGTIIEEIAKKMELLLKSVHVHVLDSCAACVSVHEMKDAIEQERMGGSAKYWANAMRRVNEWMDASDEGNTIVLIDQIRDKIGQPGAPQPPGGRFLQFVSSLNLYFKRGSWLFRDENGFMVDEPSKLSAKTMAGNAEPCGIETVIRVEKSRVCRPFRTARVRIDFSGMKYDLGFEWSAAARHYGIVENRGSWYYWPDGSKVQGERPLRADILANPEKQALVRAAMQEDV